MLTNQVTQVVATFRKTLPEPHKNVFPHCSDLSNSELLSNSLHGIETVIHLAWDRAPKKLRKELNTPSPIAKRNLHGLDNLIKAAERVGTRRIVFLSCSGANALSICPNLASKYTGERMVLQSRIPERIIIRSPLVLGGDQYRDRALRSISNLMRFPLVYPVPGKAEQISYIHLSDLVAILINFTIKEMPVAAGIIEASQQATIPLEELFKRVANRFLDRNKFAITGWLGDRMVSFVEARQPRSLSLPRFAEIFSYTQGRSSAVDKNNPFDKFLPKKWLTIDEFLIANSDNLTEASHKYQVGLLS
jgi:nucleoside-diphosphate-sugar epimerase